MATEAVLLDNTAFARMVTDEKLQTTELGGYVYTGKRGKHGWEVYRTYGPKWRYLYTARRVATQTDVGGGTLVVTAQIASGQVAQLVSARMIGPVSNVLNDIYIIDEDAANHLRLGGVTSASADLSIPSIGTSATGSGNSAQTTGMLIGPGSYIRFQAAGSANTETMTVAVSLLLPITSASDGSDITWAATSSGTVSLAASTISAANTMQAVLLP